MRYQRGQFVAQPPVMPVQGRMARGATGQIPNDLAKRDDSLRGVSSALSLMSNIVVAWNTEGMQAALNGLRAAGARLATRCTHEP